MQPPCLSLGVGSLPWFAAPDALGGPGAAAPHPEGLLHDSRPALRSHKGGSPAVQSPVGGSPNVHGQPISFWFFSQWLQELASAAQSELHRLLGLRPLLMQINGCPMQHQALINEWAIPSSFVLKLPLTGSHPL